MGFDSPWNLAFGPSVYYFSTPEGAHYHPSNSARPRPRALPSTHVLTAVCVACSYRPAMDYSTGALKSSSSASAAAARAAAASAALGTAAAAARSSAMLPNATRCALETQRAAAVRFATVQRTAYPRTAV